MFSAKRLIPIAGGVLAASIILMRLAIGVSELTANSSWLTVHSLSFEKQADISNPILNGNVDCYPAENSRCILETNYGEADSTGAVRLRNSTDFYPVYSQVDNRRHFISIPNSDGFLTYTTEPVYGVYLNFNYGFTNSVKKIQDGTSYDYQVIEPPDGEIKDQNNDLLAADTDSLSFSENADWMVLSSPNVGMYRVNLSTLESNLFAAGFDYTKGISPAPQTAITNDGRYVAVASKDYSSFKLYDLSTCSGLGISDCKYRDLLNEVQSKVPNFYAVSNLRFINDEALGFYASSYSNGTYKIARYVISPTGNVSQLDLLGLGDSYISGEGAFEYLPGTDTDNKCHLSSLSYPLLLGESLNFNSYHSVACSGATTNDIKNTSISYAGQTINRIVRDKLSQAELDSIISNFDPGYIDQLDFVKQYQPKSIVLSVGGNDVNMIGKLKACIKPGTCYSTYEDRLEFVKDINNAFLKLVSTYQKLKQSGPPDMRIYVVAYPQIAKPGGNCALNVHLDNDEVVFTNQAISYLDYVVKAAADKAGVIYVDTQDAFYGHRFCEAGPGSVAINGVTAGNEIPKRLGGPIGSESFHPNAFGHELLENKILELTHNLTVPMPDPNPNSGLPSTDNSQILDAPKSGRAVNLPEYDPGLVPDLAYAGTPIDLTASSSDHSLSSGTVFNAELHSDAISLGTVPTDVNGNIEASLTIPANAPIGYHTLHLYGADLTGQRIDIYKDIYIAKTADDMDGNGANDSNQKCVGIDASNQDYDNDGIDDACDPDIGAPSNPPASMDGSVSGNIIQAVSDTTLNNPKNGAATTIFKPNFHSTAPRVLSDSTEPRPGLNVKHQQEALYIKPEFYGAGGAGFLALSSITYLIKRRWF